MKQEIIDQILVVVDENGGTTKWGADLEELLQADIPLTFPIKEFEEVRKIQEKKLEEAGKAQESKKELKSSEAILALLLFGTFVMGIAYILQAFLHFLFGIVSLIPYLLATLIILLLFLLNFHDFCKYGKTSGNLFPVVGIILMKVFEYILHIPDICIYVFADVLFVAIFFMPFKENIGWSTKIIEFVIRICVFILVGNILFPQ